MRILISPSIREFYKGQIEYNIDIKLIDFLNFTFGKKIKINFNPNYKKTNYNLIILCGGNDIPPYSKSKSDIVRNSLTNKIYNHAMKNKIPIFGICYGAQYIGYKNNFVFQKKKKVKNHIVYSKNKNQLGKKKFLVNSFKNIIIKKTSKNFSDIYFAVDNSIECFINTKKKLMGVNWHPERYKRFKSIDKLILKRFYDSSNIMRR
jgi:hypothetical protein